MVGKTKTEWLDLSDQALDSADQQVLEEMEPLWKRARQLWDEREAQRAYRRFVAADYQVVFAALASLRDRARTFLEWGSGLGVVTIMASRLGYEAYGIEVESELIASARQLADQFGPDARFAQGNYIPPDYEWLPEHSDDDFWNDSNAEPAYAELKMDLDDFDLVYAYPFPDEQPLCQHMMSQCGSPDALLLCYDVREGMMLTSSEPGAD